MSSLSGLMDDLRFRAFLLKKGVRDAIKGNPINPATFTGSTFDRVEGLGQLLASCDGASILDIGACDGLVSYEFARGGAALVHGFDYNYADVAFAQRLFRSIPCESAFIRADLSRGPEHFLRRYSEGLRDRYDIVLFLGVYQHLKLQMPEEQLRAFLDVLLSKSGRCFAIRTDIVAECEEQIRSRGFRLVSETESGGSVGKLQVYEVAR